MGGNHYDPITRGGVEQPFLPQMEFVDPNLSELAYKDFNLDSWIYDVLPNFT
jgi:hypothetical protein